MYFVEIEDWYYLIVGFGLIVISEPLLLTDSFGDLSVSK